MSKANKCDVCGAVYDLYPDEDVIYTQLNKADGEYVMIDCCPTCTKKVLSFMDVLRNYPDNYCVTVFDNAGDEPMINNA